MRKHSRYTKSLLSLLLAVLMTATVFQGVSFPVSAAPAGGVTVQNLQVEYRTNPIGIDNGMGTTAKPRFSWVLDSDARGVVQESYTIYVAASEDDLAQGAYLWTGEGTGRDTFGIHYGGPLTASTRYFWKVEATTNIGAAVSGETAFWEMGLMNNKIAGWDGARWISAAAAPNPAAPGNAYTIEFDFRIVNDNAGFVFCNGADTGQMFLWQFNTHDYGGTAYFRPHKWGTSQGLPLANINISSVIPNDKQNEWYSCKIVVSTRSVGLLNLYTNTDIVTSLGPRGGTLQQIDSRSFGTNSSSFTYPLRRIGFRQTADQNVDEVADYTNIRAYNGSTTFYTENFASGRPSMFQGGEAGKDPDGTTYLHVGGNQVFLGTRDVNVLEPEGGPLFRKGFTLNQDISQVKSATLYATARGAYEFSLNGQKAGDQFMAPGASQYTQTIMYQTYDVTDLLEGGGNVIGARLGRGWWSSQTSNLGINYWGNAQSLLGKLRIKYADDTVQNIVTGSDWVYLPGPIMFNDNILGETYDARKEVPGWDTADCQATGWRAVTLAADSTSNTSYSQGFTSINVTNLNLIAQIGEGVRQIETLSPISVSEPVPGRYIYDFGQNMVGFVNIKVKGTAGQQVRLRFSEMLNTDVAYKMPGGPSVKGGDDIPGTLYLDALRTVKQLADYYTLKGDPEGEEYQPTFTFHGFQYLEISGVDNAIPLEDVTGIVLSSDNAGASVFETSSEDVNRIYLNALWGWLGNSLSIPTDCPQRDERMGWSGDTQVFARSATYLSNANQFFTKWLYDLRNGGQDTSTGTNRGRVSDVVPRSHPVGWGNSGWHDAAIIVPWQLYQQYGDKQILRDAYDSIKMAVDYRWNTRTTSTNLSPADSYGDWVAIPARGRPNVIMTSTIYSSYIHKLFANMCRILGDDTTAATYDTRSDTLLQAVLTRWGQPDGTLSSVGTNVESGNNNNSDTNGSQTPYAMLLYFGLGTGAQRAIWAKALNDAVIGNGNRLNTGFIGVSYLCPALAQNGYIGRAYTLLEQDQYPSWVYSIRQGATTAWERWNSYTNDNGFGPVDMNSFNHYAFGSICQWLFQGVLGIERDESSFDNAGYRKFILNPQYGGSLTWARGHYDSVSGRIESSWRMEGETFTYDCVIPANTAATVYLPLYDSETVVYEGDIPAIDAVGVESVTIENGKAKIVVSSGAYHFTTRFDPLEGVTKTLSIGNPGNVDAGVSIAGEIFPLPFLGSVPARAQNVTVFSNNPNYAFSHWTGDLAGSVNPLAEVWDGFNVDAHFKYIGGNAAGDDVTLDLAAVPESACAVNGVPVSPGPLTLPRGLGAVIDVIAPAGSLFTGWADPPLLGNPAAVVLNGDLSAAPKFLARDTRYNIARGKPCTTNDELPSIGAVAAVLTDGVTSAGRIGWSTDRTYSPNVELATPIWVEIDLGADYPIDRITLWPRGDMPNISFPQAFRIMIKADGASTYANPLTPTGQTNTGMPHTYDFELTVGRYVRIEVTRLNPERDGNDKYRCQLCQIEVFTSGAYTAVGNISVAAPASSLLIGETLSLSAFVAPANAENKGVVWFIHEDGDNTPGLGKTVFGGMSDKALGVTDGNDLTITALKPGWVVVAARAADGGGVLGVKRILLYKTGYVFTDDNKNELEHLTSKSLVTTFVRNNISGLTENLTLLVALYTPEGKMVRVVTHSASIEPGQVEPLSVRLDLPENVDGTLLNNGYYVNAFLWEADTYIPVFEKCTFR